MRAGLDERLFPFLSGLSEEAKRALGALVPTRAKPYRPLLRRGDVAGGAYFVLRGVLRVYHISSAGREATLYSVSPGNTCILALSATMREEQYPAWVDSGAGGSEYIVAPPALVRRLLDEEKAFRDFAFDALSGRIFDLMRTIEEVGFDQIQRRLARYLIKHQDADMCVRSSQAAIAAELGTAREVVFRALRALSAPRIVATGRLRIQLLDAVALRRIANGETSATVQD